MRTWTFLRCKVGECNPGSSLNWRPDIKQRVRCSPIQLEEALCKGMEPSPEDVYNRGSLLLNLWFYCMIGESYNTMHQEGSKRKGWDRHDLFIFSACQRSNCTPTSSGHCIVQGPFCQYILYMMCLPLNQALETANFSCCWTHEVSKNSYITIQQYRGLSPNSYVTA